MTRLKLDEILIGNLGEEFSPDLDAMVYMPKEEAYQALRRYTGQDFGYDIQAWVKWFKENSDEVAWRGLNEMKSDSESR